MLDLVDKHSLTSSLPGLAWFVFCVDCTLLISIFNVSVHNGVLKRGLSNGEGTCMA